jgi:hypothetical protein
MSSHGRAPKVHLSCTRSKSSSTTRPVALAMGIHFLAIDKLTIVEAQHGVCAFVDDSETARSFQTLCVAMLQV